MYSPSHGFVSDMFFYYYWDLFYVFRFLLQSSTSQSCHTTGFLGSSGISHKKKSLSFRKQSKNVEQKLRETAQTEKRKKLQQMKYSSLLF